jgi:hypothetical protein
MLKARIEALETEERQFSQETIYESSEGDKRGRGGAVGRATPGPTDRGLCAAGKALMRNLMKVIRVIIRDEIVPTYRIPPLVRAVSGSVGGADRDRTDDLLLAKQVLYQLSYRPWETPV